MNMKYSALLFASVLMMSHSAWAGEATGKVTAIQEVQQAGAEKRAEMEEQLALLRSGKI